MKSFYSASFCLAPIRGVFCSLLALAGTSIRGNVVTAWNQALAQFASAPDVVLAPHLEARVHAMTHLAIVQAIDDARRESRHEPGLTFAERAATAAAALEVITALMPQAAARAEALAAKQLAEVPEGMDKVRGLTSGRAVAARMLRDRADDGWAAIAMLNPPNGPLPDRSEARARAIAAGENPPASPWGAAKPFLLKSAAQIKVAVPAFTAVDGTVRLDQALLHSKLFNTVDRTNAAGVLRQTWDEGPIITWNRVARTLVEEKRLTLREQAGVFALLNLTLADATLTALHWRFTLGSWGCMFVDTWVDGRRKPLRASDTIAPATFDGVERGTVVLETQRVLIAPLADHPSLAATLAGAAQAALAGGLKSDRSGFTLEFAGDDGAPLYRSFGSIAEAARESAFVATLDGRHTREAGIAGHGLGTAVGRNVLKRFDRLRR